jgi:hypothetical protein
MMVILLKMMMKTLVVEMMAKLLVAMMKILVVAIWACLLTDQEVLLNNWFSVSFRKINANLGQPSEFLECMLPV